MYYRKLVEVQNIRLISKDSDSAAQGRFRESAFNKLPGDLYASDLWTTLGRTLSGCCSVTKLCPTLCNRMDCSISGFPVLHSHRVCSNSYPLSQWCHPTISSSVAPFPLAFNLSQHQVFSNSQFFSSGGQSIWASASVSLFQWIFRVGFLWDWLFDFSVVQGTLKSLLQHHNSKASFLQLSAFFTLDSLQRRN